MRHQHWRMYQLVSLAGSGGNALDRLGAMTDTPKSTDSEYAYCRTLLNTFETQSIIFCHTAGGLTATAFPNVYKYNGIGSTADMPTVTNGAPLLASTTSSDTRRTTIVRTVAVFTDPIDALSTTTRLSTITTTESGSVGAPSTAADSTTSSPTSSVAAANDTKSSSGLSAGSIGGISVGSFVGMALLGGLLAMLFLRRRKRKNGSNRSSVPRGTLGGAVLPGTWDRPEGDSSNDGQSAGPEAHSQGDGGAGHPTTAVRVPVASESGSRPSTRDGLCAHPPTMSVNSIGPAKPGATHRARYEDGRVMPWAPDTISNPGMLPASPELESPSSTPRLQYQRGPPPPPPQFEVEGTDNMRMPQAAEWMRGPGPKVPDPNEPQLAAQRHSDQSVISPLSSPRSGGSGSRPSPNTDAGGFSAVQTPSNVSGLSARGSWGGYLSAEQALAGGWTNEEPEREQRSQAVTTPSPRVTNPDSVSEERIDSTDQARESKGIHGVADTDNPLGEGHAQN